MKKNTFLIGIVSSLLTMSALAAPVLSGGYQDVDTDNSQVAMAGRYLASEVSAETGFSIDIVDIQMAQTQVVAGTNVKVCMAVSVDEDKRRHLVGVVYKPLSGGLILTRWGWVPSCFAQGKEGL